MYKLKSQLPLKVRIQVFYSFVQSPLPLHIPLSIQYFLPSSFRHIKTIQTKTARYMYKLKSQLPLKVRIQVFYSFVQSHINYCSLVWGFSTKTNIDSLFRTQKKVCEQLYPVSLTIDIDLTVRYLVIQNRILLNMIFSQYKIENVIVLNALVFMHKARHFPLDLPRSVRKTVAEKSPLPGATHESSNEWLQNLSYYLYKSSVFYNS